MASWLYSIAAKSSRDTVLAARFNGLSKALATKARIRFQSSAESSLWSRALSHKASTRPPIWKPSAPDSRSRRACCIQRPKVSRVTVRDWPSSMSSSRVVPMSTSSLRHSSAQSSRHSTSR